MSELLPVPKPKHNGLQQFFKTFGIGREKEFFLENLSLLLSSGMPISQALRAMKKAVKSKQLFNIVEELEGDINTGQPFWHAFAKTGLFPAYVVSLIRIGEESGRLSENLKLLSRQQEKERVLKDRIHSAMIYPAIVLGLTVTLGIAIAWFILPRLSSVFLDLRLKVPLLTRLLIGFGVFLQKQGMVAVPLFLMLIIFLYLLLFVFSKTKILGEKLLFVLPGVGTLMLEVELSRLGYVLGNLLEAGVPLVHALDLLSQAAGSKAYGRLYGFLKTGIEEGNSFEASFAAYPGINNLVPVPVQQMVAAGEQSGKLEQIFISVGANYEQKSEITAQNLTIILEPVLLVIVWVGVGGLALAVIVPLYSLVGSLNDTAGGEATSLPPPAIILKVPSTTKTTVLPPATSVGTATATSVGTDVATTTPAVRGASIVNTNSQLTLSSGLPFLYARGLPQPKAPIAGKIYPKKSYSFSNVQNGWYLVILDNGKTAWVDGDYVEVGQ